MLKCAHTTVFEKRETYGEHSVIVSLKDLETLLFGSTLLDLRVNEMYKNLLSKVSPQARQSFELEGSRSEKTKVGDGAKATQQSQDVVKDKDVLGPRRIRPPSIVTGGVPLMARGPSRLNAFPTNNLSSSASPHMKIINHTAQPIVPAKAPAPPTLPLREASSPQEPRLSPAPPKMLSMPSLDLIGTTLLSKRTLIRSPGQSPKKKKAKAPGKSIVFPKSTSTPKKPKKPLNEYMIWSSVERQRLGAENHISSRQLLEIWDSMTAAEKAPFIALRESDQARWWMQRKHLEDGGSIDPWMDERYWKDLWDKARAVPRSEAASNAKLYVPLLGGQDTPGMDADESWSKRSIYERARDIAKKLPKDTTQDKIEDALQLQASRSKRTKPKERKSLASTRGPMAFPLSATPLRPTSVPTPGLQIPHQPVPPKSAGPYSSYSGALPPLPATHLLRRMPAMHFQKITSRFTPFEFRAAGASVGEKSEDLLVRLRKSNAELSAVLAPTSELVGEDVARGNAEGSTSTGGKLVEVIDLTSDHEEAMSGNKEIVAKMVRLVSPRETEGSEGRAAESSVSQIVLIDGKIMDDKKCGGVVVGESSVDVGKATKKDGVPEIVGDAQDADNDVSEVSTQNDSSKAGDDAAVGIASGVHGAGT
jgi:hypothetical protein